MKLLPPSKVASSNPLHTPLDEPKSVRTIRVLGQGRAAQAVLVEAVMPDGRRQICVEKVFSAGWLTRTIYRFAFQSPFAYQSNREAVLTCFYRRRVAAAVLSASGAGVKIATPLYVRFDQASGAWVLAAQWIDGRGIKPAPADRFRLRRRLSKGHAGARSDATAEVHELVAVMHQLETLFNDCGLVGSGWQVAPRALVSTANLLRTHDQYTIIDLESGIPAVLVPKYVLSGARQAELPPFDDLDEEKLRSWVKANERLVVRQLGADGWAELRDDVEKLLEHSSRWKASELALLRRPWRLLSRDGMIAYQQECSRRWQQEQTIDSETAASLPRQRWKARLIWYAGLLPGNLGRLASRLIGNREDRKRLGRCLRSAEYRKSQLDSLIRNRQAKWIKSQRLAPEARLTPTSFVFHRLLKTCTPPVIHRLLTDRQLRRKRRTQMMMLLFSADYQSWFGQTRIEASIESWRQAERISSREAQQLRAQLSGSEVRAYLRGLGAHLGLKTLTPIITPAKYGGIAAFLASGNLWFLLPMLLMPAMRTAVTLASWWSTRGESIPHGEALLAGLLPTVGSIAFPLQMFAARSELSVFLIRDAASKLGRALPIYGGPNSRSEIAVIRSADLLIELLDAVSTITGRLYRAGLQVEQERVATLALRDNDRRAERCLDHSTTEQMAEDDSQGEDRCEKASEAAVGRLKAA